MYFNFESQKGRSDEQSSLLTTLVAVVTLLFTILPFLGSYFWFFEELSNYRLYIIIIATVMLAFCTFTRTSMLLTGVFFFGAVINGWYLYPSFSIKGGAYSKGAVISCMTISLPEAASDNDKLAKKLIAESQDLVLLHDLNKRSPKLLMDLREKYPHQICTSKQFENCMVLLSRHPFVYKKLNYNGVGRYPYLNCSFRVKNKQVNVVAVLSPFGISGTAVKLRNGALSKVRFQASQSKSALIVMGRFNCAPWYPALKDAVKYGALSNCMDVAGVKGTFPSAVPSFLAFPQDHVMHNKKLITSVYDTVRIAGSSDWATVAKLQFR